MCINHKSFAFIFEASDGINRGNLARDFGAFCMLSDALHWSLLVRFRPKFQSNSNNISTYKNVVVVGVPSVGVSLETIALALMEQASGWLKPEIF